MKKLRLFENYKFFGKEVSDEEFRSSMTTADYLTTITTIMENLDKVLPSSNYELKDVTQRGLDVAQSDGRSYLNGSLTWKSLFYKGTEICVIYTRSSIADNGSVKIIDVNTHKSKVIRSIRNDADDVKSWLEKTYGN